MVLDLQNNKYANAIDAWAKVFAPNKSLKCEERGNHAEIVIIERLFGSKDSYQVSPLKTGRFVSTYRF